jgi:hypothetical protein
MITTEAARQSYARVSEVTAIPVDDLLSDGKTRALIYARGLVARDMERAGADLKAISRRMGASSDAVRRNMARVEAEMLQDFKLAYADAQLRLKPLARASIET